MSHATIGVLYQQPWYWSGRSAGFAAGKWGGVKCKNLTIGGICHRVGLLEVCVNELSYGRVMSADPAPLRVNLRTWLLER